MESNNAPKGKLGCSEERLNLDLEMYEQQNVHTKICYEINHEMYL